MKSPRRDSLLIYLLPMCMDIVLGLTIVVSPLRAADWMGASYFQVAALSAVWGIFYMCCAPVVGRLLKRPAMASNLMLLACAINLTVCGLFVLFPGLTAMYFLMGLNGLGTAIFFTSFQVFMKAFNLDQSKSVAYSTGLYIFAWSSGMSLGMLLGGQFVGMGLPTGSYQEPVGWMYAYLLGAICVIITALGVWWFKPRARGAKADVPATSPNLFPSSTPTAIDYAKQPDLAWLGWLSCGVAFFCMAILRNTFLKAGLDFGLSASGRGNILFLILITQALVSLLLCRSRLWIYQARWVGLFGLLGVAGILCFAFGDNLGAFITGGFLTGIFCGAYCFYLVFHSLIHPVHSAKYISINEATVGVSNVAGALIGGRLADWLGFQSPLLIAAGIIAAVILLQIIIHRRKPALL
ncbi:MAG: MFS transporter [Planctomycetes bacterium]|nr:MFS transporter [Planctomycetota bacterium]